MSAQSKSDAAAHAVLAKVKLWALGIIVAMIVMFVTAAAVGLSRGGERFAAGRLDAVTVMVTLASGGHGSGVVIGDGTLVLTARHVVENGDALRIRTKDGRLLSGKVLWIGADDDPDIALVRIEDGRLPAAELRCTETVVGGPIEIVGHPLRFPWTHTYGRVSNPAQDVGGVIFLQSDAHAYLGNSGGPAFDSRGRIIGVVVAIAGINAGGRYPAPLGITWIVPATQVCEMLAGGVA